MTTTTIDMPQLATVDPRQPYSISHLVNNQAAIEDHWGIRTTHPIMPVADAIAECARLNGHPLDEPAAAADDEGVLEHPLYPGAEPTQAPQMMSTYYGVPISTLGEDGDLVGLGHVEPRRFLAACCAYGREMMGDAREMLCLEPGDDPAENIRPAWAVFLSHEVEPGDWWAHGADAGTEGAIPVMRWSV